MQIIPSPINYHNQLQLSYFSEQIKRTMEPVESPYVMNHVRIMIEKADLSRNDAILEVGCGMGKFTLPLLKFGYKITGLDLSPFLLQQFIRYNDGRFNLDLHAADILDAPKEWHGRFDHIILFFTAHHFHSLPIYFQAMKNLLRKGGKIHMIEPNPWCPLYYLQIFGSRNMKWSAEKGILNIRKKELANAASFAGLEDLSVSRYGWCPPQIYNTAFGQKVDNVIQSIGLFKPILAFKYIQLGTV